MLLMESLRIKFIIIKPIALEAPKLLLQIMGPILSSLLVSLLRRDAKDARKGAERQMMREEEEEEEGEDTEEEEATSKRTKTPNCNQLQIRGSSA
jgi:hypothetical protein